MRILHVIIRLAEIDGGPPRGLVTLARMQADHGDDVTILPCTSLGGAQVIESGAYGRLTVLPAATNSEVKLPERSVKRAVESAVGEMPDIIHIHGTWRYHSRATSRAAIRRGIPYVVRPAGNLGTVTRRAKGYIKWPYFQFIEKPVIQHASAIQCCSMKEHRELGELNLAPPVFIVPQPVEDTLLDMHGDADVLRRLCPTVREDSLVVLYLGRLTPIKQLPKLLEAFTEISGEFERAQLVLAGPSKSDDLVSLLTRRIGAASLEDRVHLPGMVRDGAKADLLRRADIFAQPSRHENFGISTAEALLFGKPCVVNSGVALADEIASAGAGIRYHEKVSDLVAALRELLSNSQVRQRCASAAERLARRFRPDVVARQLKTEYERILGQ